MARSSVAAALALLLAVSVGSAADTKAEGKKQVGTWVRDLGNNTVTFTFGADDKMTCVITGVGGEGTVTVHAAYGVAEGDTVFAVITKVEKKGTTDGPEKGELFSFQFKADKDTLTLSDMKSTLENAAGAKQLVEGEYKKKGK
jgi:hypothetical protein